MAQMIKNLPAMWETWVRSQGWEDPLEEGMATHSGILAWRIPMERGAWWATVQGVAKSWTRLSDKAQLHSVWLNKLLFSFKDSKNYLLLLFSRVLQKVEPFFLCPVSFSGWGPVN